MYTVVKAVYKNRNMPIVVPFINSPSHLSSTQLRGRQRATSCSGACTLRYARLWTCRPPECLILMHLRQAVEHNSKATALGYALALASDAAATMQFPGLRPSSSNHEKGRTLRSAVVDSRGGTQLNVTQPAVNESAAANMQISEETLRGSILEATTRTAQHPHQLQDHAHSQRPARPATAGSRRSTSGNTANRHNMFRRGSATALAPTLLDTQMQQRSATVVSRASIGNPAYGLASKALLRGDARACT